jgi:hypothetical protein
VFKLVDGELARLTQRDFAADFDPLAYDEFRTAVGSGESGSVDIGFTRENGAYRVMRLYFRYMPLYSVPEKRYLVVTGVSTHNIVTPIPVLVSAGQWISMAITFALNIWLIIMISRVDDLSHLRDCELCEKARGGDENV